MQSSKRDAIRLLRMDLLDETLGSLLDGFKDAYIRTQRVYSGCLERPRVISRSLRPCRGNAKPSARNGNPERIALVLGVTCRCRYTLANEADGGVL